jgi:hypothetical protein
MRGADADALAYVRAAIRELESATSTRAIVECADPVVCIAEGRLLGALDACKEALSSLEDVFE